MGAIAGSLLFTAMMIGIWRRCRLWRLFGWRRPPGSSSPIGAAAGAGGPASIVDDSNNNNSNGETSSSCCVVCMERPRNTLYQPCRHLATCLTCHRAGRLLKCPMCRQRITDVVQVYL
jgi:hypothetical protein